MSIYLHDIPLIEAQKRLQDALEAAGKWQVLRVEEIPLDEQILGRILAEPIWAKISSPHYHASAMDGFAVRSSDTDGAMLTSPVNLNCEVTGKKRQATYLDTGDPLPMWANAVIPIENIEPLDEQGRPASDPRHPQTIRIRAAVPPWSHVFEVI